VRAFALIAAALHVMVVAVVALPIAFFSYFPWENQTPEDAAAADLLLVAAPLMLGLATAFAVALFARRVPFGVALALLATEYAVDAGVLVYALGVSVHSDGKLLLAALAVAAPGAVAVIAVRRTRALVARR
jgi:hypothetical protein